MNDIQRPQPKTETKPKAEPTLSMGSMRQQKMPHMKRGGGYSSGTKFFIVFAIFGGVGFISWHLFTFAATQIGVSLKLAGTSGAGSGLVGHWTFDGKDMPSGLVNDVSGNGLNGSLQNFATATAYVEGKIGQALYFNGANTDITFPTGPFSGTGPFTVSAWIRTSLTTGTQVIAAQRDGVDINGEFLYEIVDGKMRYWDYNGGYGFADSAASESNSSVADGQWHHVAFIRNGTTGYHYIDGQLDATVTGASAINMSSARRFGIGADNRGALSFFKGNIDDVRVYNRQLSLDEVKQLYQVGATTEIDTTPQAARIETGTNSGLMGHWTFDGSKMAQNVGDSSAQGTTAYLTNFTSTTTTRGVMGQGLQFDGVDDFVNPRTSFSQPSNLTVALWFKTTKASQALFGQSDTDPAGVPSSFVPILAIPASGVLRGEFWTGVAGSISSSGAVTDGVWHHVALVGNTSTQAMYLDGVLVGTRSGTINHSWWTKTQIGAGYTDAGRSLGVTGWSYFKGSEDDARVYNRALSADEVAQLYQMGATTKVGTSLQVASTTPGGTRLTGYWTFDGKNIDTSQVTAEIRDSSGSAKHGDWQNHATTTARGVLGQALLFDGVNDAVTFPGTMATYFPTDAGVQSVSLWIKPTAPGPSAANVYDLDGIIMDPTLGDFGIMYGTTAGFTGVWAFNYDGTSDKAGALAPVNEWTHVALVHSGGLLSIYTNGVFSSSTPSGNLAGFSGVLTLGKNYTSTQFFQGMMDDVRTYDRALSLDEIKLLYSLAR